MTCHPRAGNFSCLVRNTDSDAITKFVSRDTVLHVQEGGDHNINATAKQMQTNDLIDTCLQ